MLEMVADGAWHRKLLAAASGTMAPMTRSNGKLVAVAAAVVGIATVGLAGFAFRSRIMEEYYIWKLRSNDPAEVDAAAERLGAMRSARAVPALLEAAPCLRVQRTVADITDPLKGIAAVSTSPYLAIGKIGRFALPALSEAFNRGNRWKSVAYSALESISESEGLHNNVEELLLKVEKDSIPGSAVHKAATDLLPKWKAYESQILQTLTGQASP